MMATFGINELCGDADAAPGSPYAAFEDAAHTQGLSDRADILILSTEGER